MGRHRSSLRDLGWGISNSPNPWKQGSAKRVVRALDYSNVHEDAAEAVPAPAIHAWEGGQENDPRLQHDSRQLESIREQLAAEDTENRRKLERLNGRIAELGEHKRGMWSVLGQQCKNILEPKLVSGPAAGLLPHHKRLVQPGRHAAHALLEVALQRVQYPPEH